MDDTIEQFDWIPEQLTKVLEDILADTPGQAVPVSGDGGAAESV